MKNLLKYGIVVLALFAISGLLWADSYVEVVHDTVITPCENETIVVNCTDCGALDSLVQNNIYLHNTISSKESKDTNCWYVKLLKHIKEYGKIYIILALLLLSFVNMCTKKGEKKKNLIKWIYIVAAIAVLSESSWCYLILMALFLLYITENDKELINQIGNVIATLQGKNFKTEPATQADKSENESEQRSFLEKELQKMQQVSKEVHKKVRKTRGRVAAPQAGFFVESSGEYVQKSLDNAKQSEEKIIAKLCKIYPQIEVQRVVVVNGKRIFLDGFIQTEHENIIVEIKYFNNKFSALKVSGLEKLLEVKEYIQQTTHKSTSIRIFIVTSADELKEEVAEYYSSIMTNKIKTDSIYYSVYSFDELDTIQIQEANITLDFQEFMDHIQWDELNLMEKLALFDAAHGELNENGIPFAVKPIEGSDDVKLSYIDSPIALRLTTAGKKDFPHWLEQTYMNGEDGYSYLGFWEAMEKND